MLVCSSNTHPHRYDSSRAKNGVHPSVSYGDASLPEVSFVAVGLLRISDAMQGSSAARTVSARAAERRCYVGNKSASERAFERERRRERRTVGLG